MSRIADEIARLETLDRAELVEAWMAAYGTPPFKGARRPSLLRGLSYHTQCKSFGPLRKSTQKTLMKVTRTGDPPIAKVKSVTPKAKLGSQLVREWNGQTYSVHVTDTGFVMNGVTYRSLSSVTKAITGAHWSGPRFFGVST